MYKNLTENICILFISILYTLIFRDQPFFWDTIQLGSKHAHWFYDHAFNYFFLPTEFDSGHIPTFGIYLASMWYLLGKSLFVSHLAMAPFIFIIIKSTVSIVRQLTPNNYIIVPALIILSDPTLMAQASLISPDTVLIAFFLCGLTLILKGKTWPLLFIYAGLIMTSNRGIVATICLATMHGYSYHRNNTIYSYGFIKKSIQLFTPAILIFTSYHFFHYHTQGWMFFHAESPWAESFEKVNFERMIYNVGLMTWRYLDFGRITGIVILLYLILRFFKNLRIQDEFKMWLITLFSFVLFSSVVTIPYAHLTGHRYYMPGFLLIAILTIYVIHRSTKNSKFIRHVLYFGILASNILGHVWVYPDHISQGWDSSLAYIPYHSQRNKVIEYLNTNHIELNQVGSEFPNLSPLKYIDLSTSTNRFIKKNLFNQEFIYYSNVFNNFSDTDLDELSKNWEPVLELKSTTVHSALLKKRSPPN